MRGSWGELHNIYETRSVSLFEENPLPPWTRDPESNFSMIWDMTSAVMLLYVTVTVPLRVCFNVEIELWCGPRCRRSARPGRFADFAWLCAGRSFDFFVDLVVDLFFITDVAINCRTSYYDSNGFRENRPDRILKNYLKGWFFIDFLSVVQMDFIVMILDIDVSATVLVPREAESTQHVFLFFVNFCKSNIYFYY